MKKYDIIIADPPPEQSEHKLAVALWLHDTPPLKKGSKYRDVMRKYTFAMAKELCKESGFRPIDFGSMGVSGLLRKCKTR